MRIALHPANNEQITFVDYVKNCGRRPVIGQDFRPHARCPFCQQNLTDVAGKTGDTTGHFAHFPNSGFCPSKEPAGRPYIVLTPVAPDPEHGRYLKAAFLENWERFYLKLGSLVPCLSLEEFFALVAEANRLRVWEYRHLEPWEIPYVVVLMVDFPAMSGIRREGKPLRKYWFRFWYDASVQSLDNLWIRRQDAPVFFRASFTQPERVGTIPGYDKVVKFYPLERERDYLNTDIECPAKDWIREEINRKLPKLLGL